MIGTLQGMIEKRSAVLAVSLLLASTLCKTQQQDTTQVTTIKVQSNIVLTNVVVRDKKTGEVVKG